MHLIKPNHFILMVISESKLIVYTEGSIANNKEKITYTLSCTKI